MLYTDGAQYLAEHAGAYWLLDNIAIAQAHVKAVKAEEFQVWTLKVNPDSTALLTCDDGNNRIVYKQSIPFTDFPLPEISISSPTRRASALRVLSFERLTERMNCCICVPLSIQISKIMYFHMYKNMKL